MAIILYIWWFIVVPFLVHYWNLALDGREVYALHGWAVLFALLVSLIMSSRQSVAPREVCRDEVVSSGHETGNRHDEEPVDDACVSYDGNETKESLPPMVDSRDRHDIDDDRAPVLHTTPRYVRGAIVCATKVWSFVSFAWLCLLAFSLVMAVHPWYIVGGGSLLLLVWLWWGLVSHPFPFSFFGFAMHIREWVQWRWLCLFLVLLTMFGDSGKFSVRLFVAVTSVLALFWIVRLVVSRIRRIKGAKFRLFRSLTWVWFVLLATIFFQAFLFARGHIIQSRQHMQALMREYTLYQFTSFGHDIQRESVLWSLIARSGLIQPSSSVSQSLSFSDAWVSWSWLLFALSWDTSNETSIVATMWGRKQSVDVWKKTKDREPDPEQETVRRVEPTFRNVLKFLLANYPKTTTRYTFANVPSTDPDYALFATARRLNMIGTDVDPNRVVVCQTFFVMQGLVWWWRVSWQWTIFDQYWNEARRRWVVWSCQWWQPVPQSLFSQ